MSNQENNIRAMVLAAGVGSRLQPLSDAVPKPLIQIGGRTIMDHILLLLKKHGIKNIISNTHHLAEQIHDHFKDIKEKEDINIQFIYEEKLSGVAGGIRTCKDFLKESTACIIMGDALTDVDLTKLYKEHKKAVTEHNCIATMAMMEVEDTTQFGVIVTESMLPDTQENSSSKNRVVKFQEKPQAKDALSNWANTGIYFFEPEIYDFIPEQKESPKYDVAKDLFPKLLEAGKYIQAVEIDKSTYWADLGTPKQYLESIKDIAEGKVKLDLLDAISPQAEIAETARLEGYNEIAAGSKIAASCTIKNSILWNNVRLAENVKLDSCIIGPNTVIESGTELKDQVLVAEDSLEKS